MKTGQSSDALGERFGPLDTVTIADAAYQQLRESLFLGRFLPGEVLTIRGLAGAMGVSTMPIRVALTQLVSEGALEALPNRTLRVPWLSRDRLEDLARARILLEGEAVSLATQQIGDTEIRALAALCRRSQEVAAEPQAPVQIIPINRDFHFTLYRAARSPALLQLIDRLWVQSGPYLAALAQQKASKPEAPDLAVHWAAYHQMLQVEVAARSAVTARQRLVAEITQTARWYSQMLSEPPAGQVGAAS